MYDKMKKVIKDDVFIRSLEFRFRSLFLVPHRHYQESNDTGNQHDQPRTNRTV